MVSLLYSKTPFEKTKQPSRKEICCQGKSKEIVGNWNQRFLDAKVLISIVYSEREENKRGF